ncbi:MAG: haloacid dehalogenase [Caldilineales bacterium]|nr:haloacid dehalogenase [Caldilineales bacterium]
MSLILPALSGATPIKLDNLAPIIESIRSDFTAKNGARDQALSRSRELIRHCSLSIRATHRHDFDEASEMLAEARTLAAAMTSDLEPYPDIYEAGYTQDALKEVAEAHIIYALVHHDPLPEPESLGIPNAAYLGGLAEAAGELRRFILDLVRQDLLGEAEALFLYMDDIYSALVTIDFPDAITGGLRRQTDMVRGVTERTRGDLTVAVRQRKLEQALRDFEARQVS